jgi:amino acid transporter
MTSDNRGKGRSFIRRERHRDQTETRHTAEREQVESSPASAGPPTRQRRAERERIVVPREERSSRSQSGLDIELREVHRGLKPGDRYLRVVPGQRLFRRQSAGYYEATRLASKPRGPVERVVAFAKGIVLGSPFASSQLAHERLSKVKALAIFSSDAFSSSAYATEEILLILLLAGSASLDHSLPIAAVIVLLLAVVTISYRQTVRFFPSGGGAYSVAQQNLGRFAGLLAAAALTVGYILTVSVSVAAGIAAVTSAVPDLHDFRVPMALVVVATITLANLRGLREAGTLFAVPTYFFLAAMFTLLAIGFSKVLFGDAPGDLTSAAEPVESVNPMQALSLIILLRAFAAGCAGLTGVEAISNGVPAFKAPESGNARATLAWMALILGVLLLGVTFLATRFGVVPSHDETVVSQLGKSVMGENALYYGFQVATALVLFLAANTSYAGFPLMAAILATDRFMPRQFAFRGDRLAYSNGMMFLAVAAAILIIAFGGSVTRLIPLYALGVFISFTLSQGGMVRHLRTNRQSGWRTAVLVSGVGAAVTLVVAIIIGITRFTEGAWISIIMMAALMGVFTLIRRHYDWFERKTAVDEEELRGSVPPAQSLVVGGDQAYIPPRDVVIVPVDGINKVSMGAIAMARELSRMVVAVHLTDDREKAEQLRARWSELVPDVPLHIVESPYRSFVAPMLKYLELLDETEERRITVILPSFVVEHWWERLLHNRDVLRLRPFLKEREGIRVLDFPYRLKEERAAV